VDGPANTILLTEVADSDICWLEPRDLNTAEMSFQPNAPAKPSISAVRWRQPYVVFADHIRTYGVSQTIPAAALKALTTIAGGEPMTRTKAESLGYLD
jgi:hypothetical protein